MRWKSILLIFVLSVLGLGTLAVFSMAALNGRPAPEAAAEAETGGKTQSQPLVTFIDPSKGAKTGAHLIVEYGDFSCPYCRSVDKEIERFLAVRPDVRFVWKTVPSPLHPGSANLAEGAQCAHDQGKFWEFRARLFADGGATTTDTGLGLIAKDLGLDVDAFTTCLTSDASIPVIERNIAEAKALGVDALPYFFIDGKRFSGQLSYEQLEASVR